MLSKWWRQLLPAPVLLFSFLSTSSNAADPPVQDQRALLTIPFEDREDILRVMRSNLDQVRQAIPQPVPMSLPEGVRIANAVQPTSDAR